MKFGICKFALLSVLASVCVLVLAGCGASNNLNLTQGNWSMTAKSSGANGTFYIGGNLAQSGTSLAGTMYIVSSCMTFQPVAFAGSIKGNTVTLASDSGSGQVLTVTATGSAGSMTGTYTVSGGCADGDSGSVTATTVPAINGTWSGPISGSGGSNVTLAIAFTQASTPSTDGTFALTGNVTFTNSSCSVNGTVTNSSIAGPYLIVNGTTNEQDGTTGDFTYTQVFLNNPATPTSMKGTYQVGSSTDEPCANDLDTPTFTKQ